MLLIHAFSVKRRFHFTCFHFSNAHTHTHTYIFKANNIIIYNKYLFHLCRFFHHTSEEMNRSAQLKPVGSQVETFRYVLKISRISFFLSYLVVKQYYPYWPIKVSSDVLYINYSRFSFFSLSISF